MAFVCMSCWPPCPRLTLGNADGSVARSSAAHIMGHDAQGGTVDTHDIRRMVDEAIREEAAEGRLKAALTQYLSEELAVATVAFVSRYTETAPALMEDLWYQLQGHGALQRFRPIFDAMFHYWEQADDVVPDHLGLVGLSDDAYLTKRLLECIDQRFAFERGVRLVNYDLAGENASARATMPGVVAQLEQVVQRSMAALAPDMMQVFGWLASAGALPGMLPLTPGAMAHNQARAIFDEVRVDREVNVRLGMHGIGV